MFDFNDLYSPVSFCDGGGGGDGGGDGGGRNVNAVERAACAGIAGIAGGAAGTAATAASRNVSVGLGVGAAVTSGAYDACVASLSTEADYDGMMTAP